ncbi:sugar transferase [Fictibacillus sp. 26RED30]|uniref:sugar transferase n=1 Tax=Fictibacillus sp. 26RED30 TaxID=2745877 RepID=UPI0018CF146D|nr:sugar transferase [Fictibacillus sp. 26RED30]MBH0161729.1 sugar transferase [Fictibacillus sp. 26RED30]
MGIKKLDLNFHNDTSISEREYSVLNNSSVLNWYLKRFIDIIGACAGIILTFPIILFFSILIKLDSPGPVFFLQERVGLNGKVFNIIKLRSMRVNAEIGGQSWAQKNDVRITGIGKFIRKTRIDEFPQFINVLTGEMSLIGPRPEVPFFTKQFSKEILGFEDRLMVKPGITGWAQINGGYDLSAKQKLEYDMFYIRNWSFLLELEIVIKTIKTIFNGNGAR